MAGNGRLTEKSVSNWFASMDFDGQQGVLNSLGKVHDKMRQAKIAELSSELAALKGDGAPARSNGVRGMKRAKVAKKGRKLAKVAAKFRDPKTGDTWSGRGRMAGWLAAKVKAGEKADKYAV